MSTCPFANVDRYCRLYTAHFRQKELKASAFVKLRINRLGCISLPRRRTAGLIQLERNDAFLLDFWTKSRSQSRQHTPTRNRRGRTRTNRNRPTNVPVDRSHHALVSFLHIAIFCDKQERGGAGFQNWLPRRFLFFGPMTPLANRALCPFWAGHVRIEGQRLLEPGTVNCSVN